MRKRVLVSLVLLIGFLTGCAGINRSAAPEPTPDLSVKTPVNAAAPTPEPTPEPEPEAIPGLVVASNIGAVYTTADRGTQLAIVGEEEQYYQVDMDGVTCLIEKQFLRPKSEAAPAERTVYARGPVSLYRTVYLRGDPLVQVYFNDTLKLIDDLGAFMLVEKGGIQGYILSSQVGDIPVANYDGGPGSPEGGDSQLGFAAGSKGGFVRLAGDPLGLVLGDGVELYLAFLSYGQEFEVMDHNLESYLLNLDGQIGTVPHWAIQLEGDVPYRPWDAYTTRSMTVYEDYRMLIPARTVLTNIPVRVMNDCWETLLIELDGEMYYTKPTSVSHSMIQFNTNPGGSSADTAVGTDSGEGTAPVL